MHQQTQQNKKKKQNKKTFPDTETTQHKTKKSTKHNNKLRQKKASRRTWFLQPLLGIQMFNLPFPFSSPTLNLCRCLLVHLDGNDWGKSLVWGVGFFFCCLPNVAANKEWGIFAPFLANSSWVMGWKIWERFLSGGRAPQQHKNHVHKKRGEKKPILCLQK